MENVKCHVASLDWEMTGQMCYFTVSSLFCKVGACIENHLRIAQRSEDDFRLACLVRSSR